ncbi:hypothetical protein AG1IA_00081 [Rhizoctonia solani AG-1 IA]|uniref:Uncharacterized protein n=1 Tax=Thanatephorus cucumeris (strain AG1-IA) TaxID=983506 RepID=L8X6R9_THACA|nr:hypothetical protein AG1IA_00081 [Rhizoctonia solani AG-1 IA]
MFLDRGVQTVSSRLVLHVEETTHRHVRALGLLAVVALDHRPRAPIRECASSVCFLPFFFFCFSCGLYTRCGLQRLPVGTGWANGLVGSLSLLLFGVGLVARRASGRVRVKESRAPDRQASPAYRYTAMS